MPTIGKIEYVNRNANVVVVNVPVYGRVECVASISDEIFDIIAVSDKVLYGVVEILPTEAYFLRVLNQKDVANAVKANPRMNVCDFCSRVCQRADCVGFKWSGMFDVDEGIRGYC